MSVGMFKTSQNDEKTLTLCTFLNQHALFSNKIRTFAGGLIIQFKTYRAQ